MWRVLAVPVLVVALFWLVSSLATTYYLRWIENSHTALLADDLATIRSAGEMRYNVRHLQNAILDANPSNAPAMMTRITELEQDFTRNLQDARRTSLTPRERELVDTIAARFPVYQEGLHRSLDALAAGKPLTTADFQRLTHLVGDIAEPCKQLSDTNEKLILAGNAQTREVGALMTTIRVTLLIIGPALGLLCGLWISWRLHRSISRISVTLNDAAAGADAPLATIAIEPAGLPKLERQADAVALRIRGILEELQNARRHADAAARLATVGELATGLAHELRNPLTSVKLLIQTTAQRQAGGGPPPRELNVIQEEIARMEQTIERLLHFARPAKMNPAPHDIRQTLQRAANLVAGRAARANVTVSLQLPPDEIRVHADPEEIHHAITNLFINAIDAMADGGELTVTARVRDPATCRIQVADTGPGIPPHLLERIFDPFVTGKAQGIGLGLAISRRIAAENNGALTAANAPTRGAVFTLDLPLAAATPTLAHAAAPAGGAPCTNS